MTLRGSTSSTRRRAAAWANRASRLMATPGGDGPAQVLAGRRDGVEGGGRAEVDDHAGPAEQVVGTDGVGDPVGPHLLGVVVEDGHARSSRPGSSTTAGTSNHRATIWRRLAVTSGTDEVTAMPVTASSMSSPSRSRSWVSSRACSSAVRSATVDRRQWWARPGGLVAVAGPGGPAVASDGSSANRPDHRLGVADVDGEQHGQSFPPDCGARSNPRSSTGAEWVRAPTEMRSAPAVASRGRPRGRPRRTPPPASSTPSARSRATHAGHPLEGHVVQHDHGGPGGHRLVHLDEVVALHLHHPPGPQRPWPGPPPPRWTARPGGCPSPGRRRTGWPGGCGRPPARTAAFSRARSPGVVLRVSSTRVAGLAASTASTNRRVSVATPDR